MTKPSLATCLALACLALAPGCGGGSNAVWVEGKLLKGGVPYVAPPGHLVSVTFVGLETLDPAGKLVRSPEPFEADYDDSTSNFTVPGREGKGIPPGKYRVAVTQKMAREAFDAAMPKAKPGRPPITRESDFLDDQFGPTTSPVVREVKASSVLVIDLDRPAGGATAGG